MLGSQAGDQIEGFSNRQLKQVAKSALRNGDKYNAILLYETYRKRKPDNSRINYALAELYRQTRNYVGAKEMYAVVLQSDDAGDFPLAAFYYGQVLKTLGEYEEASKQLKEFRKNYIGVKDARDYRKLSRAEQSGSDSARILMAAPLNVTIDNINSSVNSRNVELSPIPINDNTFMYASLKVDSLIVFSRNKSQGEIPVRQFYQAHKEGMDWIGGEPLGKPINLPGVETGNGVFSRDGKRFYFTRCEKDGQGRVICSLYQASRRRSRWTQVEKLPLLINDPNYTATQPALGRTIKSDREIIYFVSDRPGGKGGLDIWYTVWDEKTKLYSEPKNLGSKINTAGDEMTPYYDLTKRTLYFSSDGWPGMGGLDIFKAFGSGNNWENLQNVGYPLNTGFDDLYYTVSAKGEDGFFVSNRPDTVKLETCCDDIFYYRWNDFIRITVTGTIYPFEQDRFGRKKDLSGFDFMNPDASIQPLDSAKVALYRQDKNTREYLFMDRFTTGTDGKFYFTLEPDEEYEFRMEGFQYFDSKNYLSTQFFNFSDTIEMPPTWVNVLSDKPIKLENVYYQFNSSDLTQADKQALDTTLLVLLKEAPEFIIEIGAHTDSIGDMAYNLKLSQERANNIVNYLATKGIPAERLVAKGYGPTHPVAPNFLPDGSDNEAGREQNRRTEFRIVGTIDDLTGDDDEVFKNN